MGSIIDLNLSLDYETETLSGRKLWIPKETNEIESVETVKRRIAQRYENDGEVGDDFELYQENGNRLESDDLLTENLLRESGTLHIRRKRYSCFVEHLISDQQTWKKWLIRAGCVIFGSLFIAAMTQVSFYLPHAKSVPVTFQTLAIFLIGSLYGWIMGGATVLLYLLEGLAGAPFFSSHGHGYKFLYGPTSGYLYGFLLAVLVVGFLAQKGRENIILNK
eukprot:gene5032-6262_t